MFNRLTWGEQNRQQSDILLIPPVQKFSMLDFNAFDEIVEIGYRYTAQVLEEMSRKTAADVAPTKKSRAAGK